MKNVAIELSTPRGIAFAGEAAVVELRSAGSALELRSPAENCLSTLGRAEITLRRGEELLVFALRNAWASFDEHRLVVLAESIRRLAESPKNPRRMRRRPARNP
jgi:hypothetical protein